MKIAAHIVALIVLTLASFLHAAIRYVCPDGNCGGTYNYSSVVTAADAGSNFDTIRIINGPALYNESNKITMKKGQLLDITSDDTIQRNGNGEIIVFSGDSCRIDGHGSAYGVGSKGTIRFSTSVTSYSYTILSNGYGGHEIRGVVFYSPSDINITYARGIQLYRSAGVITEPTTIENCIIRRILYSFRGVNTDSAGVASDVSISSCLFDTATWSVGHRWTFTNNIQTFTSNENELIRGADSFVISNNAFVLNGANTGEFITTDFNGYAQSGARIENNVFSNQTHVTIAFDVMDNSVVTKNIFLGPSSAGTIYMHGSYTTRDTLWYDNSIIENTFRNLNAGGSNVLGSSLSGRYNARMRHGKNISLSNARNELRSGAIGCVIDSFVSVGNGVNDTGWQEYRDTLLGRFIMSMVIDTIKYPFLRQKKNNPAIFAWPNNYAGARQFLTNSISNKKESSTSYSVVCSLSTDFWYGDPIAKDSAVVYLDYASDTLGAWTTSDSTVLIKAGTRDTLAVSGLDEQTVYFYRLRSIGSEGTGYINDTTIVYPLGIEPPVITVDPGNETVVDGEQASFSITATGDEISYQWQKNGTNIDGATSATYSYSAPYSDNGATFRCIASNSGGADTSASATLTVTPIAPTITVEPVGDTVVVGQAASFSVTATGSATLLYKWQHGGDDIVGATSATYNITSAEAADSGYYRCIVTNDAGSDTSASVRLGVIEPATITVNPDGDSLIVGQEFSVSVTASGSTPISYQWQKNGTDIDGATSYFYSIPAVIVSDEAQYRCIVSNAGGSDTSVAAPLVVFSQVVVTVNPKDTSVVVGTAASFSVTATGNHTPVYQWQKDGENIVGATSSTYSIDVTEDDDAGAYRCIVANAKTADTSSGATLTIIHPAEITENPENLEKVAGESAVFSVTATGTAPIFYQWQKNGTNIDGATSATYTISSVVSGDAGAYRCIATNSGGSDTSTAATLTVIGPAEISTGPVSDTVNLGSQALFFVVAGGTAPITYKWQKGTEDIVGSDNDSLVIASASVDDEGQYRCIVSNSGGSDTSAYATLTVRIPPEITEGPQNDVVDDYGSASFSVVATGTAPLVYQWRKNGSPVGTNAANLTFSVVYLEDNGADIDVIVSNAAGSDTSAVATLTVTPIKPVITSHPRNAKRKIGSTATFSVSAYGTGAQTYQWRLNGENIPGATAASYTTETIDETFAGNTYSVVVTNAHGSTISNDATLLIGSEEFVAYVYRNSYARLRAFVRSAYRAITRH